MGRYILVSVQFTRQLEEASLARVALFSGYGNTTTHVSLEAPPSRLMGPGLIPPYQRVALPPVAPHNGIDSADLLLSKRKVYQYAEKRLPPIYLVDERLVTLSFGHAGTGTISVLFEIVFRNAGHMSIMVCQPR